MTDRNIGMEILDGIKEIKKHKKGELELKAYFICQFTLLAIGVS